MKILLVVKSKIIETLGAMYLSAVVKQTGNECRIVEMTEAVRVATSWKPDIVGYSIMTGDQEKFQLLNNSLKQQFQFISIVGGPHPTFFPDNCKWADYIVRGEGEEQIAWFLGEGSSYNYPDINSFPWPDRTDFPNMKIRDFITTRGCPWSKCAYCYNDQWNKLFPDLPRIRIREVEDVVTEIKSVNPEFVYFQDSCFATSIKWLKEFNKKYKHDIGIPFHCHLRPKQIIEEQLILLANSNCKSLRIALESASPRLRKFIRREDMDNAEMIEGVTLLKKWKIKLMIQSILGLPTSTIEDDMETLELNIQCKPDYAWSSIFSPFPGTALGDECQEKGWYLGDYSDITDCFFDKSVLEFSEEHKEQTYLLQKVFALCVETEYLPKVSELTYENFPKLIHKIVRKQGDKRLYGGLI